jgi:DNA-directed RNA polymerase specialized sigma24 family protein
VKDVDLDARLENWARAQRMGSSYGRSIGSAEGRYEGETLSQRSFDAIVTDLRDADIVERAWTCLLPFDKDVLRMHYILCMDSRVISRKLRIPYRGESTFLMALAHAKSEISKALGTMVETKRIQSDRQRTHLAVTRNML